MVLVAGPRAETADEQCMLTLYCMSSPSICSYFFSPVATSAHLVTSAIFLPRLVLKDEGSSPSSPFKPGSLSFANRLLLLQTYLSVCTAWKIYRGNHPLPIADFYAATDAQQFAPAQVGAEAPPFPGSAWTRIIPSALRAPDGHVPKIVRALIDFSQRWGSRPPGYFCAGESEAGHKMPSLEGIERLDGTLFVRVAGLTLDRLGWVHEGEKASPWDTVSRSRKISRGVAR